MLYELFLRIATPIVFNFLFNWGFIIVGHIWVIAFIVKKTKKCFAIPILAIGFGLMFLNILVNNRLGVYHI